MYYYCIIKNPGRWVKRRIMERKFVFIYFGQKALCSTPEQAFAFINSLCYHGNGSFKLSCNNSCMRKIWKLFGGIELRKGGLELATTGCSTTRIKVYPALADTLDEHERIYAEKTAIAKAFRMRENEKRLMRIDAELDVRQHGWYSVELIYKRHIVSKGQVKTYIFHGEVIASCGRDAYNKTVKYLDGLDEINFNFYPEAFSNNFQFDFLREPDPGTPLEQISGCCENLNRQ